MAQCRKCGLAIRFEQRRFSGVLKWYPTNLDGSDHWDICKTMSRREYSTPEALEQHCNSVCPVRWTMPKPGGGYRVTFSKPNGWDERAQPAPETELVDWDVPPEWMSEADEHLRSL